MAQPRQRELIPPELRADGTWRYALQVVIMNCGKWQGFGHAHYEFVGWATDLDHRARLQDCLI